jgi:hypothetical protein
MRTIPNMCSRPLTAVVHGKTRLHTARTLHVLPIGAEEAGTAGVSLEKQMSKEISGI